MKINKLNRSFVYKGFKNVIIDKFGDTRGAEIWSKSGEEYERLLGTYPQIKGDSKMMVLPAAAIYTALKKYDESALEMLRAYGANTGKKIARIMHVLTSIPGLSKLLWKNMPAIMRKTSSPEAGYTRRIVSESDELVGVDILTCPLHDAAVKIGMLEVATVVCAMDKEYMTGFKFIRYERTTSVADGGECCDYRLSFDKDKK